MKELSMQELVESIRGHEKAIRALNRGPKCKECDCPTEADPYDTGDTWYEVKNCQNPFNCVLDDEEDTNEDDEESEE